MKLLVCAVLLGALAESAADANPFAKSPRSIVQGGITVPPEWAGIWQTTDSTYDCTGALLSSGASFDTLCAGVTFEQDPDFSCTGSVDANSYTQHCTGSGEIFPDCNYTFDVQTHGTRTGDTFFSVSVLTTTYSGTGEGCDFLPDMCQQFNSHATRIGPAPTKYCSTPVEGTTWGQIKSQYR